MIELFFGTIFGYVFRLCWIITDNFFWTIFIFTLISKIVLLPVSFVSQKNSIIMIKIQPLMYDMQARYEGELETLLKEKKALYKKEKYSTLKAILPLLIQIPIIVGVISVINHPERYIGSMDKAEFYGLDLLSTPINLVIPSAAIISTLLLCAAQNKYNVLAREQGFFGKHGVTLFLVVFTGFFSFVCPQGVGIYWILSNIMAIGVLALCNIVYDPKKFIDYENRSVKPKLTKKEKNAVRERGRIEKAREKNDMKRFFSCQKELVFYSEASGFYKYFQHFIDYILANSDITVHYLTSDINDQVFNVEHPRLETYFCKGYGLITTFMKMDANIVVMTMPDLNVYHYKRSLVKKDIEYIYTDHGIGSFHLMLRKGALDHYDTIFCYGKNHNEEICAMEKTYGLPEKKLVNVGFGLLDMLIGGYESSERAKKSKPQILIAPSWQKDNILEYCLDGLLSELLSDKYKVVIRPHPEFIKRFPGKMKSIFNKYGGKIGEDFEIQTDFSSNSTVYLSDLVITDWSSIAQEFSFTTKKPSLFINTPMKIMNPEWEKIGIVPMEIWMRDKIGMSVDTDKLETVGETAGELLDKSDEYKEIITNLMNEYLYNIGRSAEFGGEYIINQLRNNGITDKK